MSFWSSSTCFVILLCISSHTAHILNLILCILSFSFSYSFLLFSYRTTNPPQSVSFSFIHVSTAVALRISLGKWKTIVRATETPTDLQWRVCYANRFVIEELTMRENSNPPIFVQIYLHRWIGFMRSWIHFGISVAKLSTSSFYLHLPSMWPMAMTTCLCIKRFCAFSFHEFRHYAPLTPSQRNFDRLRHVLWFDGIDLILIQRLQLNCDFDILVAWFSLPLHVAIHENLIWS